MQVDARRLSAAAQGRPLDPEELRWLLDQPPLGLSAYEAAWAAQKMGRRLAENKGQIFAQIGIDANPCPENCLYCGYAAVNNNGASGASSYNLPADEVLRYARIFADAGVHLISLMATAAYDFDDFCSLAAMLRAELPSELPLLANIADIDYGQALRLKQAGIDAFYHAVRIGEGVITRPSPQTRHATIEAVKRAGLKLMSGIEPLYQELGTDEIAEKIVEVDAMAPLCSGACNLHAVKGSAMRAASDKARAATPLKQTRLRQISSIARLASGEGTLFGFCAGIAWVDAGADPRGRELAAGAELLKDKVAQAKQQLENDEWSLPARPLAVWKAVSSA
jgi:biotin synthase